MSKDEITVTKEEFLKEFEEKEWTPYYYSDHALYNRDCVSFMPQDLIMGVSSSFLNLNLHWSPKHGLLVFDSDWGCDDDDWMTVCEYFENCCLVEEPLVLWSVSEFEILVCELAEKASKKLWKEYIEKEYLKSILG